MSLLNTIRQIPPVTRFFAVTSLVMSALLRGKYVSASRVLCDPLTFIETYYNWKYSHPSTPRLVIFLSVLFRHCYRFFTAFMVLPPGDQVLTNLMQLYFFYTFAGHLESRHGKFRNIFPDALWFTLICGTLIHIINAACWFMEYKTEQFEYFFFLFPLRYLPFFSMLSCVTFIWSRVLKNSIINFMGVIPIQGIYLPLLEAGLAYLAALYVGDMLVGYLAGYLYLCIQSGTLPFYNLIPSSYSKYRSSLDTRVQRVGASQVETESLHNDAIWDLGYLKAPAWLYSVLNYPNNYNKSYSAFDQLDRKPNYINSVKIIGNLEGFSVNRTRDSFAGPSSGKSTGASTGPKDPKSLFRGTGHKLGS